MGMEEKGCLCCGNGNVVLLRHYENCGVLHRITQGYVTLQSHVWMSKKRSRVGAVNQKRREERMEETLSRRGQRIKEVKEKKGREGSGINQ